MGAAIIQLLETEQKVIKIIRFTRIISTIRITGAITVVMMLRNI